MDVLTILPNSSSNLPSHRRFLQTLVNKWVRICINPSLNDLLIFKNQTEKHYFQEKY